MCCSSEEYDPHSTSQRSLNEQVDFNRVVAIDLNNKGSNFFEVGDDLAAIKSYEEAVASLMMCLKPEDNKRVRMLHAEKVEAGKRRKREMLSPGPPAQGIQLQKRRRRPSLLKGQLNLLQCIESSCDFGTQRILDSQCLSLQNAHLRDANVDLLVLMYNMALVHLLRFDSIDSISFSLFRSSLSVAPYFEGNHSHGVLVYPAALNNMGTLYWKNEEHEKALTCFVDALRVCRLALQTQEQEVLITEHKLQIHEYIGTISSNIGRIYYTRCEYHKSAEMYKESLAVHKLVSVQHAGSESTSECHISAKENLVTVLYNLGVIYYQLGELDKSMEFYLGFVKRVKMISQRNKTFTTIEEDCSYSRDLVAAICNIFLIKLQIDTFQESNETKAITMSIKQLQLTRAEFGNDHEDLPSILRQVGSHLANQADYESAISFLYEALRVEKSQGSPSVGNIAITLNLIGQTHQQNSELEKGMKYYFEASILLNAEDPKKIPRRNYIFSVVLYNIGMIYYRAGSYDQATQVFGQALTLSSQSVTVDNAGLLVMLHNIGVAQLQMGRVSCALKSFNMSLDLRMSLYGERSCEVAESLYQIAHIHDVTGKTCMALDLYTKTVNIEKETLGKFHPDVVVTLCSIGEIYHSEGVLERALNVYMEALGILRRSMETNSSSSLAISSILNIIGDIYLEVGEVNMAIEAFADAAGIAGSRSNPNDPQAKDFVHVLRKKMAHPQAAAAA
eukprot:15366825-Ditylum_brightwellii.AAC.1